jgi:UDP-N-acetylmuramoyl-tripeptide--D-alanyl-D-alanine ligase
MRPVTAQWVANAVGGALAADVDAIVTSVVKDSRDVTQGALYVAFVGERVDGHDFVGAAVAAGAALCLVTQPVAAPHLLVDDAEAALGALARAYLALLRTEGEITVVGITGSNGKTTTKDLLAQVLPDAVAPVGSYNNEIGMPITVLAADSATRHLVLEMGASGPGHIAYLTSIAPPDIAVVLMVGTAHAGGYDTPDGIARAKAEIVQGLAPGGVAVLNADDPAVAAMAVHARRVVTFGLGADATVCARDLTLDHGRASFVPTVSGASGSRVTLTLVGEHHAWNALAAIAVAIECGMDADEAARRVAAAGPVSEHRMAVTERADGVTIIDDSYNASPESMRAAFRALLDVAEGGRTFAVIGEMLEMGDASREAHWDLGHAAVRLGIDYLVVVGEGAKPAFDAAVREGSWGDEAEFVATIDDARSYLAQRLAPGDTVLVKASHGSGLYELADELVGEDA